MLDAARELFITKGFEATAVSEIVKKVGVAQGLFYYYFKSKDEALNALLERDLDEILSRYRMIVAKPDLSAISKLKYGITQNLMFFKEKTNLAEYAHRQQNEEMHYRLNKKLRRQVLPLIIVIIRQGVAEGSFHTLYPEAVACILFSGIQDYLHEQLITDKAVFPEKLQAVEDILERVLGAEAGSIQLNSIA